MKKITLILTVIFSLALVNNNYSQVFWTDSFETTAPDSGTRACPNHSNNANGTGDVATCGSGDYFFRTNLNGGATGMAETFTNIQGSFYWRAEDLDGCAPFGANPDVINFTGIDITGKSNLVFKGLFGARNFTVFEGSDNIIIEYSIDGAAFVKGLAFESDSNSTVGGSLRQDTNLNGTGDGAFMTTTLTEYSFSIPGTGTNLSIKLTASVDSSGEEIGFDYFTVESSVSSTAPTVTTTAASVITSTSANLAGNVTADGGATVTERGIVYSTSDTTPTIAEGATKDTNGTGTGVFTENISSLAAGTTYYFNSYAINSVGTSYGTSATFTTTGKGFTGGSADWGTATNWSGNTLPSATDEVVIPSTGTQPTIANGTNALAKDITIDSGATLTIATGGSLTMDGNLTQNGTFNINSDATTNGSLIVKGTSGGNVTYKRYLTTSGVNAEGWHLIGAPVSGQSINSFSGSFITSVTKKAISPYVNNVVSASRWNYYTTDGTNPIASAGNFVKAKGYSTKIGTAGTLDFTGTLSTENETIVITDGGDNPAGNRWNLISNPYTAALKGGSSTDETNSFLRVNIDASTLDASRAGLTVWNGTAYIEKSVDDDFFIAPGQAFFVHAPDGGGTSASFTEAMQTHQTGNIFLKNSASYPEAILQITDGTKNSSTKIRYIQNRTTGLDVGSDIGTFTGVSNNFKVFTHLLSNSYGVDFAIQALPNTNYDNMVVPVGINAEAGKEITFSMATSNFSSELKIYLEDRLTNTFTRLDENNSTYKVTLKEAINGVGRFYMKRHAYLAAAQRAERVMLNFQGTSMVGEALALQVEAYKLLGQQYESQQALALLKLNYPKHEQLDEKGKFIDSGLTKEDRRTLIGVMSFGLIE